MGDTGLQRTIKRSAELQKLDPNGDVRAQGGIDFDLIQRTINYWYTYSLDLFGGEISSNASTFFATGLKGRFHEHRYDEHRHQGIYAGHHFDPQGNLITAEQYACNEPRWLLVPEDDTYLSSIMKPQYAPGKFANWTAAATRGIEGRPIEFEYVKMHD